MNSNNQAILDIWRKQSLYRRAVLLQHRRFSMTQAWSRVNYWNGSEKVVFPRNLWS